MRTLLVEDDESTRELIELILQRRGHDVTSCEDAEHAWDEFSRDPFKLAVIDLMLPGKDGLELCRQIRRHAEGRDSTLVVCTARNLPEDLEMVLDSGADDYLTKPFDPTHFSVRVRIAEHMARMRIDRKLIEQSLHELSRNLDLAQAAVIGRTMDGAVVSWNSYAEKLFGYTAEEIKAHPFDPLIPEDRKSEPQELLNRMLRGEKVEQFATQRLRKGGELISVVLNMAPIHDPAGNVIGTKSVTRDVSSDRRVEEKLRITEDRLRGLFESNLIGMIFWDASGRISNANDTFLGMLGYAREDLDSGVLNWTSITPAEYAELDRVNLETIEQTGSCLPFEKEYFRKDGSRLPVLVGGAALKHAKGEGVAFVLNVSNKKMLEEQLRQAQKMEAVGRLAGGIAHDFNNLLTVIIGRSEMVLSQLDPKDKLYKPIELVRSTGSRAAALTRQLLQFSRQQVLQPKIVSLKSICSDMREMMQRLLGENVELSIVAPPQLRPARVDPSQIQQVILNLVLNARDAMPNGGRITLETSDFDLTEEFTRSHFGVKPGPHVMLSVADTGSGMTEAVKARLFEPFFTTKEQGKGTGLGLSTVYGIVKQSGGDIWVYSEPGHGTIFKVYFPAVSGEVTTESNALMTSVQTGAEMILVVEDEESIAVLLRDVLTQAGYNLLVACNPVEALEILGKQKARIDMLLTDVVMPKMNGRDLAAIVSKSHPGIRILYMSGYSSNAISDQGGLAAGVFFLEKPFTPRSLLKKVREVLDAPETAK